MFLMVDSTKVSCISTLRRNVHIRCGEKSSALLEEAEAVDYGELSRVPCM